MERTTMENEIDFKRILCQVHPSNYCVGYCETSKRFLCTSCLVQPQEQDKLKIIYDQQLSKLERVRDQINEVLPFFETNTDEISKIKENLEKQFNEIEAKILTHTYMRKCEISNASEQLHLELKQIWNPSDNLVSTFAERFTKIKEDLKNRKTRLDEALSTRDPSSILSFESKLCDDIPEKSLLPEFEIPKIALLDRAQRFPLNPNLGMLLKIPQLTVINEYIVDYPDISGLTQISSDVYAMYSSRNKHFTHFILVGTNLDIVLSYGSIKKLEMNYCRGNRMANITEYKGNLLLYDPSFCEHVMHICNNTSQRPFIKREGERKFYGLHSWRDTIFIGYHDCENGSLVSGILIMDVSRQSIRKFERSNKDDGRLFTIPTKLSFNSRDRSICIIDHSTERRDSNYYSNCYKHKPLVGRVVVVSEWGEPRWTYYGNYGNNFINNAEKFTPEDIETTSCGNVLVADRASSTIHVLSADGEFITHFDLRIKNINLSSLLIDRRGRLLIGCSSDWDCTDGGDRRSKKSKLIVASLKS